MEMPNLNIQVPHWFSAETEFCYNWHADGERQCNASAATLCAKVNQRTDYYRDDTHHLSGGCQMRWGIVATNYPEWFRQVQICYRWYADGDYGQCGDHSGRGEACASVGTFTNFYRDDTDKRDGGCRMSWRLFVPLSAPTWTREVKLCYFWQAEHDAGECGDGVAHDLCAPANQWTPYYRDDTDDRAGGCFMAWSLMLTK